LRRSAGGTDSVEAWTAWHRDTSGAGAARRLMLGRRALAAAWARGTGPAPKADIVHAPTPLFPPRRSRPLVVTVHDAVPWTHPETLTPHGVRWHRQMIERAARYADAVTVPSETTAQLLAEFVPALTGDRVQVLGAGVSVALREPPEDAVRVEVRRRLALPERYLLTVATLEPRKGLDVLMAALSQIDGAVPLVVVGQAGWGGVDLPSAARAAGVDPARVRGVGRVGDRELGVILRDALALVAPSRAEGFGLPLVEAMAAGLPVICTDIAVFAEVTAGAAVTVPVDDPTALADAITHVLADDGARARLAQAGLRRSAAFDWDAVAQRAWALYRDLLAG
jgi:glycosyltransferase involved in cell wall biosynthesis